MRAGIAAFLDECAESGDPPDRPPRRPRGARLGALARGRRRKGLGLIEASLAAAIEAGEVRPLPVRATAHLLLGALDEAAMLVAASDNPAARGEAETALFGALLDGLAPPAG